MRYVYLLLILVLISSCAHNKLRLRKVDKHDHVEVAQENRREKRTTKEAKRPEVISVTEEEEVASEVNIIESEEVVASNSMEAKDLDAQATETFTSEETTVAAQNEEPSKAQILREAMRAERNAKNARNLMLAAFISVLIPLLNIFSIFFFIVGSVYLFFANRSNYITTDGERIARSAQIMQIIYAIILLLLVTLVLAFIFL